MAADLANDDDLLRVDERLRALSNLGLLVNNAGFGTRGFFFEADIEGQESMHRVHVMATMRLTHAALANLVAEECGRRDQRFLGRGFLVSPGASVTARRRRGSTGLRKGLAAELAVRKSPGQGPGAVSGVHAVGISRHARDGPQSDPEAVLDDGGFRGDGIAARV